MAMNKRLGCSHKLDNQREQICGHGTLENESVMEYENKTVTPLGIISCHALNNFNKYGSKRTWFNGS